MITVLLNFAFNLCIWILYVRWFLCVYNLWYLSRNAVVCHYCKGILYFDLYRVNLRANCHNWTWMDVKFVPFCQLSQNAGRFWCLVEKFTLSCILFSFLWWYYVVFPLLLDFNVTLKMTSFFDVAMWAIKGYCSWLEFDWIWKWQAAVSKCQIVQVAFMGYDVDDVWMKLLIEVEHLNERNKL